MKHINLRLDTDTHARLAALADAENRSINNMLIVLIDRAAARRDGSDSPPP